MVGTVLLLQPLSWLVREVPTSAHSTRPTCGTQPRGSHSTPGRWWLQSTCSDRQAAPCPFILCIRNAVAAPWLQQMLCQHPQTMPLYEQSCIQACQCPRWWHSASILSCLPSHTSPLISNAYNSLHCMQCILPAVCHCCNTRAALSVCWPGLMILTAGASCGMSATMC